MARQDYVDVLFSQEAGEFSAGSMQKVIKRLKQNNTGLVQETKRQLATKYEIRFTSDKRRISNRIGRLIYLA
jgi:predicted Zn-dependent peptidase